MSDEGPRGRAFIARVDDDDPAALKSAIAEGLAFVRRSLRGGWTVLPDGSALPDRRAPGLRVGRDVLEALFALGPAASFELVGRVAGLEGLRSEAGRVAVRPSRAARLYRYQLSVAPAVGDEPLWPRLVAPAELYHADQVAAVVRLRGLPDGEPFHGALRLLGRSVPAPSAGAGVVGIPGADPRRLVEPLEIADPDLVVVDARQVGWGGDELTQATWPLGVVIVADSACAADLACCAALGIDPATVSPLRMAARRGLGPGRMEDVELGGVDVGQLARAAEGWGARPPALRDLMPWIEERLGTRPPLELAVGDGGGEAAAMVARSLLRWIDVPAGRHRMSDWGSVGVVVGEPVDLPGTRHLILVGDAAEARFLRAGLHPVSWLRLPRISPALPSSLLSFDGPGGTRWAWVIRGVQPRTDAFELALFLASRGRARTPLLGDWFGLRRRLWRWLAGLQRARRNRDGVPVVHARKIARLRGRAWRKALPAHPKLTAREPTALLPPPLQAD